MGEITIDIEAELRLDNPTVRLVEVRVFADALRTYHEASRNVQGNGAIVMHPKTGAPIENPYLKVLKQSGDVLSRSGKKIRANRVLELLTGDLT